MKSIAKALKTVDMELLLGRVKAFATATTKWPADDLKYIKNPATWFNQCCWEDDPTTWERNDISNIKNARSMTFTEIDSANRQKNLDQENEKFARQDKANQELFDNGRKGAVG